MGKSHHSEAVINSIMRLVIPGLEGKCIINHSITTMGLTMRDTIKKSLSLDNEKL